MRNQILPLLSFSAKEGDDNNNHVGWTESSKPNIQYLITHKCWASRQAAQHQPTFRAKSNIISN
ncbi:MAG TPA: hypothetical protein VD770_04590, partial [Coxiellaceae bacterium]|nr:hypothetical protein [Coxiellaceae bacterium]